MSGVKFKVYSGCFGASTDEEKSKILEERNRPGTNCSTKSSMRILQDYMEAKSMPPLDNTLNDAIPKLLEDFYADVRTQKGELYHVQTMKSMRSNLNRWFKENRDLDIIEEIRFTKANMMFKGAKVTSKKAGKGVRNSTFVTKTWPILLVTLTLIILKAPAQLFSKEM